MNKMTITASTTNTRRKPIAVFSSDRRFRSEAVSRLNALAIYDVGEGDVADFFKAGHGSGRLRLIVLDIHDGAALSNHNLATARDEWGDIPIIVVSDELPEERLRGLVRLRAVDWLKKPVDSKDLVNSVVQNEGGSQIAESTVSTFMSASGGAGATTLAVSAAAFLASEAETKDETCLVDLDFQTASCSAYLNLKNEFDLDDVISQPHRLDIELLDVIKIEREPGMSLFSFERPDMPFTQNGRDFVLRLLDLVAFRYKNIVIDLPSLAAPWFDDVLRNSDRIFVVCELNIPSLRQTRRLLKKTAELRGKHASQVIVANKNVHSVCARPITVKDVRKIFSGMEVHTVARDDKLMLDAINRGVLPAEVAKRSRTVKEMRSLFEEIIVGSSE